MIHFVIHFVKMHGCGNDFVVVPAAELTLLQRDAAQFRSCVERLCDRRFGLGADGLLAYEVQAGGEGMARVRMHYWNRDGSRAEMCGNGARCVVRLAFDDHRTGSPVELETDLGVQLAYVDAASSARVEIDMGAPRWHPGEVPARASHELLDVTVNVAGQELRVSAVSMGNPHALVLLPERRALQNLDLNLLGPAVAEHPLFPAGANASFVCIEDDEIYLRVWERGVGPTLACGTAACAALAVARRLGVLMPSHARVHLPGGMVDVRQDAEGHVWLAGPATYVARGTVADEMWSGGPLPQLSDVHRE